MFESGTSSVSNNIRGAVVSRVRNWGYSRKDYAEKMPYLDKVWDGSKGRVGDNLGYWCCMAVACENGCRRIVPLHLRLWSVKAPGYVSEGDEVQQVIMQVALATNKRGIYVYDRGGDGDVMFAFFLENALDFIVRLVGDRHLVDWGTRKVLARDLAAQCVLKYEDSVHFKSHNKVHNVRVQYGSMPVRLPDYPDRELRLVVVKWPKSEGRMMLLTTLEAVRTRESLARATCRWSWSLLTDKLGPEPWTPCEGVKSARNRAGLSDRSAGVRKTGVIPGR